MTMIEVSIYFNNNSERYIWLNSLNPVDGDILSWIFLAKGQMTGKSHSGKKKLSEGWVIGKLAMGYCCWVMGDGDFSSFVYKTLGGTHCELPQDFQWTMRGGMYHPWIMPGRGPSPGRILCPHAGTYTCLPLVMQDVLGNWNLWGVMLLIVTVMTKSTNYMER